MYKQAIYAKYLKVINKNLKEIRYHSRLFKFQVLLGGNHIKEEQQQMGYEIITRGADCGLVNTPNVIKSVDVSKKRPEKKISRKQIINHLNYVNFQDSSILINLKHSRFDKVVSLRAKPQPCRDDELICSWVNPHEIRRLLSSYEFDSICLKNENSNLILEPELVNIDEFNIDLVLSEQYYPLQIETVEHYPCIGIDAQVIQNSAIFKGTLTDFSSNSFHIKLGLEPPQTSQWLISDSNVDVILSKDQETLFSGECLIIDHDGLRDQILLCLKPLKEEVQRFRSKKFRSNRVDTSPLPSIVFKHPFIDRLFDLKASNLSGMGFSVTTSPFNSLLVPGMVLPRVEMIFANSFKINFTAQVIYKKYQKKDKEDLNKYTIYGLTFLNITSDDHLKLLSYLHQATDSNLHICQSIGF